MKTEETLDGSQTAALVVTDDGDNYATKIHDLKSPHIRLGIAA
jgi:hypothetical protein